VAGHVMHHAAALQSTLAGSGIRRRNRQMSGWVRLPEL
jgi:hypothetical protein